MIRFNEEWLRSPEMCDWLVRVSNDESRAYCRWCAIILRAHKSDLMTHSSTAKHAKNSNTAGVPTGPLNVQIVCADDPAQLPQSPEEMKHMQQQQRGPSNTPLIPRAQYAKKYRVEWEEMEELKDWLQAYEGDTSKAYCKVCNAQLRAHKHDLVLHGKSTKHKKCSAEMGLGSVDVDGVTNFITVAFEGLNDTTGSLSLDGSGVKKRRIDEEDTQEIIDTDNGNVMDGMNSMCEDTEILTQEVKLEEIEKKPGEINIIRVPANNRPTHLRQPVRKRRMVVSEVLTSIAMNEFTGYELLQIVKAAVPRL